MGYMVTHLRRLINERINIKGQIRHICYCSSTGICSHFQVKQRDLVSLMKPTDFLLINMYLLFW